ncbi:hypothetical protein [Shewanella sp.]|uniref:hypothetical protein n=1 Tax=Shewanella sp. TaxID=50422 RepID=UPI003A9851D9
MDIKRLNISLENPYRSSSISTNVSVSEQPLSPSAAVQDDQISISKEGREQLTNSNGKTLHDLLSANTNKVDSADEDDSKDPIAQLEKRIEQMQERLEEIRQELLQLTSDKSKAAENQRAQLQSEQQLLSMQLTLATTQKAKLEKMQA